MYGNHRTVLRYGMISVDNTERLRYTRFKSESRDYFYNTGMIPVSVREQICRSAFQYSLLAVIRLDPIYIQNSEI